MAGNCAALLAGWSPVRSELRENLLLWKQIRSKSHRIHVPLYGGSRGCRLFTYTATLLVQYRFVHLSSVNHLVSRPETRKHPIFVAVISIGVLAPTCLLYITLVKRSVCFGAVIKRVSIVKLTLTQLPVVPSFFSRRCPNKHRRLRDNAVVHSMFSFPRLVMMFWAQLSPLKPA